METLNRRPVAGGELTDAPIRPRAFLARLLPLSADLRPVYARLLAVVVAALSLLVACITAEELLGIGVSGTGLAVRHGCEAAAFLLVGGIGLAGAARHPSPRRSWLLMAFGAMLASIAWAVWLLVISHMAKEPSTSASDLMWYCAYPIALVGMFGLLRGGVRGRVPLGVLLDGVIAGAGVTAVTSAVLFPAVAAATHHSGASFSGFVYPTMDMIIIAILVGGVALRGWRFDPVWAVLIGAFLVGMTADVIMAPNIAVGDHGYRELPELLYVIQFSLMNFAAWQAEPRSSEQRLEHFSVIVLPAAFTFAAVGLLIYCQLVTLLVPVFALAIITLIAACARMALAFRDVLTLSDARRQAMTDELTQLPNRRMFMTRLRDCIGAARLSDGGVTAMLLDLDNFKWLNDTLGHEAGDELLRMIGPRLQNALRTTDTVARLGGDEFAVLLDPKPDQAGIERVAGKMLDALREPFALQGLSFRVTASIGVASFPDHAHAPDELMRRADVAMYLAKESKRGFEIFAPGRDQNSKERLMLAGDLATAFEDGQIQAYFQPIAEAGSRRIIGAEALVRWIQPDGTVIPPIEFVSATERAGLSRTLTRRVLSQALEHLVGWRADGHEMYVSVNATVSDLLDIGFPDEVAAALDAHEIPPHALVLEVTETSILSDPERIGTVLERLCELGVGLALDDFGTGYSSLAHLRTLSVGEVKIDRSFVKDMCEQPQDAAIVYGTIELAHRLGHQVVAEGVEDDRTWGELCELGCDRIQGYALSKPATPAEFARLLAEHQPSGSVPDALAA